MDWFHSNTLVNPSGVFMRAFMQRQHSATNKMFFSVFLNSREGEGVREERDRDKKRRNRGVKN